MTSPRLITQIIVRPPAEVRALALRALSTRHSVPRRSLRKSGLRATVVPADGTDVLRVRLYRVAGTQRQEK